MNIEDVRNAIASNAELTALLPDSQAIAATLSASTTRASQRMLGNGTIIETVGLTVGNALLDVLLSTNPASPYRHLKPLLEQGRLIIGSPLVTAALNAMVGAPLSESVTFLQQHADALIALGREPDPVSEMDVRRAIWNDDGTRAV